jgi:hypothetical protein
VSGVRRERRKMRFPAERRSRERRRNPLYLLSSSSCFLPGKPAYSKLRKRREEGIRLPPKKKRELFGSSSWQRLQNKKDQSYQNHLR